MGTLKLHAQFRAQVNQPRLQAQGPSPLSKSRGERRKPWTSRGCKHIARTPEVPCLVKHDDVSDCLKQTKLQITENAFSSCVT